MKASYLIAMLLAGAWFLAANQLSLEWDINPQYQFGWVVPVLTIIVWLRAWSSRPSVKEEVTRPRGLIYAVFVMLGVLALPARILQEANPDWRFVDDYFAVQAVLITAAVVYSTGGIDWLRYFAFSILFPLTAVPWPTLIEGPLTQGLQGWVAAVGTEGATWMGWDAVRQGNLISLPQGVVGVSEACSGIRSFQSSLMASLFLGEYFGLNLLRRVVLVGSALTIAFVLNLARAGLLIGAMAYGGAQRLEQFHDPAGITISIATFLAVWFTATLLETPAPQQNRKPFLLGPVSFPYGLAVGMILAWIGAEIGNQMWYSASDRNTAASAIWTVKWPPVSQGFKTESIDETTRLILRYSSGFHGKWTQGNASWEIYFFTWRPGRGTVGLAQAHHPDICMPAAGFTMQENLGILPIAVNGVLLPVARYVFDDPAGRHYYVFQCTTNDRVWLDDPNALIEYGGSDRFQVAWRGIRNPGQRSLLVINRGASSMEEATAGFQALLAQSCQQVRSEP